ncbi:hypothetical protein P9X10_02820 [Bacillus cereus]|nr:hypothetical protein [Bacillus cereus]
METLQCKASGCSSVSHSKGYCNKHYLQIWRHKKLTPELERMRVDHCLVEDCPNKVSAKGYCPKHYYHFVRKPKMEQESKKEETKEFIFN